jgi:hypothetical protein
MKRIYPKLRARCFAVNKTSVRVHRIVPKRIVVESNGGKSPSFKPYKWYIVGGMNERNGMFQKAFRHVQDLYVDVGAYLVFIGFI